MIVNFFPQSIRCGFLLLCLVPVSLSAQVGIVPTGGGASTSTGIVEYSLGQPFCQQGESSSYHSGEGVQQTYDTAHTVLPTPTPIPTPTPTPLPPPPQDSLYDFTVRIKCFDRRLLMIDHYPYGEQGERTDYIAYRWFCDEELIPTAIEDHLVHYREGFHQPLVGCYYAEASDMLGHWSRSNIICLSATKSAVDNTSFCISPNPVSVGIKPSVVIKGISGPCQIEVYTLSGRCLFSLYPVGSDLLLPISLSAGTYLVVIRTLDGSSMSQKLIVR